MDRRKLIVVLLVCALVAFGLLVARIVERAPVQRVYLPLVMVAPPPAMKGVGLSGPCAAVEKLGVDWYYRWGSTPCKAGDKRFVAMIWGLIHPKDIPGKVAVARATSGWLLGFNEPDQEEQADMTVEEAAVLWHQIEEEAADVELVSPVPCQLSPGWLWRMVEVYERKFGRKPRFDAIAAHYYCWEGDWGKGRDYLLEVRRQALAHGYDVPIWLTEWGGECWMARNHNVEIMRGLIPWMERQPWMGRYAWFASELPDPPATLDLEFCSLTDPVTGELTKLGELYRGF